MSHFYGELWVGEKSSTRCGHKTTGLRTIARSWGGKVEVCLYYDEDRKLDCYRITQNSKHGDPKVIAEGVMWNEDL